MRSFLGNRRRPGLPVPAASPLVLGLAGVAIAAVFLGRTAREREPAAHPSPRRPAHPRHLGMNMDVFPDRRATPRLLDTETGAVTLFTPPEVRGLDQLSCAPWRDGEGRYHLVGRWCDISGEGDVVFRRPLGLARCTFPDGRVVGRAELEVMPVGPPCWSPDRSDRVLFAGFDGRLYLHDFPEDGWPRRREGTSPWALRWQADPPGTGAILHQDPCWSGVPALGGRLLVALNYREDLSRPNLATHLWWLELGADDGAIVSAERAIVAEGDGDGPSPPRTLERLPAVGLSRDGTPLLAYLARDLDRWTWDLWLMPIAPATPARGPRVLVASGRKVAEGCAAIAPAFSADGAWLYSCHAVPAGISVRRHALNIGADPPSEAAVEDDLSIRVGWLPGFETSRGTAPGTSSRPSALER